MKRMIIPLALALIVIACNNEQPSGHITDNDITFGIEVVEVDSCEYVVARISTGVAIVHKQNCIFCKQRNETFWQDSTSDSTMIPTRQ